MDVSRFEDDVRKNSSISFCASFEKITHCLTHDTRSVSVAKVVEVETSTCKKCKRGTYADFPPPPAAFRSKATSFPTVQTTLVVSSSPSLRTSSKSTSLLFGELPDLDAEVERPCCR